MAMSANNYNTHILACHDTNGPEVITTIDALFSYLYENLKRVTPVEKCGHSIFVKVPGNTNRFFINIFPIKTNAVVDTGISYAKVLLFSNQQYETATKDSTGYKMANKIADFYAGQYKLYYSKNQLLNDLNLVFTCVKK